MKLLIAGGGSAGWMTAAYFAQNKKFDITLIESDKVPIIGVGETTIPSLIDFLDYIGITEEDLFEHCSAVRKYCIQHNNWDNQNKTWMHRFCTDEGQEAAQDFHMNEYTVNPRKQSHAYHLDATKLGKMCRDKSAIPNGVKHIIDDIIDVITDDSGINEVIGLKNRYTADFYIDCTGFKSLLRSPLGVEYLKHDSLINNCAIAGPGVYAEGEKSLPYTQTFGMTKGWRWRVCLQHRTGNGYVFNKDQLSIEEAKQELIANTPGLEKDKIFVVPFRNGFNPEPWKKNVVSLGLSCGFLEPLEATGLFLVHGPCRVLEKLIDDKNGSKKFNKIWSKLYKEIAYFLGMFYTNGPKNNEYWDQFGKESTLYVPQEKWIFPEYSYRILANAKSLSIVYK
jgi:tryptophan halogenase